MSKTPLELYKQKLKDGTLHADPVQDKAVTALNNLHTQILILHNQKREGWVQKIASLGKKRKGEGPKGIYMYGGVGRGKSMLMDLFYDCLPEDIPKKRIHFHAFMIDVHDYLHSRREADDFGEGIDGALPALSCRIAETSRILCFDEFHVTDVADAMILGRLFTALFAHGVIVVATSNWEPDRLYEGGLQRDRFLPFIELLKNKMEIVHLDSETDYRAETTQIEGSYFHPLGAATHEKIDAVFAALTENENARTEILKIKGRAIPVAQTAKGAARFTFAQLCEQPHGAEDYLAIAQKYPVVFLENIPKLGYDRRNEAKRLMTLIDALYENRTRLIVSADAPPEDLYRGHDHGFEFERTISRLIEMGSKEYLEI